MKPIEASAASPAESSAESPLTSPLGSFLATRAREFARFFEQLSPARLDELSLWYAANARFKDPFNEIQGIAPIRRIFEHMYDRLDEPHFVIRETVTQGSQTFVAWEFVFRFKGSKTTQTIRGASHLQFDALGQISLHRDYWDAAEELYEKIPGIGLLMRWLKRRAAS